MKTTAILINTKSWDKTLFFVLLCAVSGVMTYAAQSLLITDDLYFSFFGDQLSYDRISEIINFSRKWQWLSYAVIPFYYLMKMFMVSTCIYTGTIIAGPEISFTRIFQVALLGARGRKIGHWHADRYAGLAIEAAGAVGDRLAAAEADPAERFDQLVRVRALQFGEHLPLAAARQIGARRGARHEEAGEANGCRHGCARVLSRRVDRSLGAPGDYAAARASVKVL